MTQVMKQPGFFPTMASLVGACLLLLAAGCAGTGVQGDALHVTLATPNPPDQERPSSSTTAKSEARKPKTLQQTPAPVRVSRSVSLGWLAGDLPVPELPRQFAPPEEDKALMALLTAALSGYDGSYSVVVRHLVNGRYAAVNPHQVYYAASLYKLGVLLEAYRQKDGGEVDFDRLLTLEARHMAYDFGTLDYLGLQEGDTISLSDAVKAMIVVSDTPTAVMITEVVGAARVDATLRRLGLIDTSLSDPDLPTTAQDMARLMEAIAAGAGVSGESRRVMLSLMQQEWFADGILSSLPAGSPVAHKTGLWADATHDVALVWAPDGPYIIAILSDRPWTWEPLAELSGLVYNYFARGSSS